jgi:hypothetical protein
VDTVDRNYVEALIERAQAATRTAHIVAESYGMEVVAEKLADALAFQESAADRLYPNGRNPNGTTGPERVTDEGVELDPPPR